jgi:GNAT superfamily N-acetyltransferase
VLDERGRIVSTREPSPLPGPLFALDRGAARVAWAVHAALPDRIARELAKLASEETPAADLRSEPLHAPRYRSLLREHVAAAERTAPYRGPAFCFPASIPARGEATQIDDERALARNFAGWMPGEIGAGRAPVLAVLEDGAPVSVCFSARGSDVAVEAGVETAPAFRGRGYAARAVAAWAESIRASGRVPLYSTEWTNTASLAVARRLGLVPYASLWSLSA